MMSTTLQQIWDMTGTAIIGFVVGGLVVYIWQKWSTITADAAQAKTAVTAAV